jgi:hypothetical protein
MTLSIIALSIMDRIVTNILMTLTISIKCHCAEFHYSECHVLFIVMLNIIMMSYAECHDAEHHYSECHGATNMMMLLA